jgi:hypothetical protein
MSCCAKRAHDAAEISIMSRRANMVRSSKAMVLPRRHGKSTWEFYGVAGALRILSIT